MCVWALLVSSLYLSEPLAVTHFSKNPQALGLFDDSLLIRGDDINQENKLLFKSEDVGGLTRY